MRARVRKQWAEGGMTRLITSHADANAEIAAVGQWVLQALADSIKPSEVGIFVRTRNQLDRARAA